MKKRAVNAHLDLLSLSTDETSHLMSFLTVGETLMTALTCKEIWNKITEIAKTLQPHTLHKWTITHALRTHKQLVIRKKKETKLLSAFIKKHGYYPILSNVVFENNVLHKDMGD